MKFSQLCKGALARKVVDLPLISGETVKVALTPLLAGADADVLAAARKHAIDKGVANPTDGDPLYEQGMWVHTLVRACFDPESPEDNPQPFFDGGAAQILDPAHGLDRDRLALLFEAQQAWQDEVSPRPGKLTAGEYLRELLAHVEVPEGAELPFERWRPVLRRSFVRTIAEQLVSSLQLRSLLGPSSPDTETSSESSATPVRPLDS